MRWITNCPSETAFERLVEYCFKDPEKHFTLGPPMATKPFEAYLYFEKKAVTVNGCSREYLESINYRGLYEVFPEDLEKK